MAVKQINRTGISVRLKTMHYSILCKNIVKTPFST